MVKKKKKKHSILKISVPIKELEGHLTHKLIHIIETVMVYSSGVHADGDCFFLLCKSGKSENLSHAGK